MESTIPPATFNHPVLTSQPDATASPHDFTQPPPVDTRTLLPSYSHAVETHGGHGPYDGADDAWTDDAAPSELHQRLRAHYVREPEHCTPPHVANLLQQVQMLFDQRIRDAMHRERESGVARLTGRVNATFREKIDHRLHRHVLRSDAPPLAYLDKLPPRSATQMLQWLSGGPAPLEGSQLVLQTIDRFTKDLNRVSLSNEPRVRYRDDAKLKLLETIGAEYPALLVEYTRLLQQSTQDGLTHEALNANVRELLDIFMQANQWTDPRTVGTTLRDRPRRGLV